MLKEIKDYIGWWILILSVLVLSLQITSCTEKQNKSGLERLKVMTESCKVQNKSFLQFPDSTTGQGVCV